MYYSKNTRKEITDAKELVTQVYIPLIKN